MQKTILVTGGAGYIGSHVTRELIKKGYNVLILDNLSKGHKKSIPKNVKFMQVDLSDKEAISQVLNENRIDAVIHFAAFIEVGESVKDPSKYFNNNVVNTINLLDAMVERGVKHIVFSSSAAVYGEPKEMPIKEDSEKHPVNPYGMTKLMVEEIMSSYDEAHGLKFIALRYFNAAGADFSGEIGEDHDPESHLIPLVLQVALDKRKEIKVFGTDYPTKDGTCVRDYIHVLDLADAHILALEALFKGNISNAYNLGNGKGYSVKEVIDQARLITGKEIKSVDEKRRPGDSAFLIADYSKIRKELGWSPKYDIKDIIKNAWNWHKNNPDGF